MTEEANADDWDIPLVDFYMMETPDGMIPTRQANALGVNIVTCRDDEGRKVVTLLLYSTDTETGLMMPLSPQTARELAEALLVANVQLNEES